MTFYQVYRKYFFKRDTILATISVFIVIGLFGLIPLNTNILNPIKTALADFEFNDLAYAKLGKNNDKPLDNRIVVVNIGWLDRTGITNLLSIIDSAKPKVIGLDVQFIDAKDPATDAVLQQRLTNTPNLVSASSIIWRNNSASEEKGLFGRGGGTYGYVNFVAEDNSTIRYFSPFENNNQYASFSASIVKTADPAAYNHLLKRNKQVEFIHYSRNRNKYFVVEGTDVLEGKTSVDLLQNKIVLIGYVNDKKEDVEDKHFTPMNEKFVGKALPDMNGIIIHANIISMMLDRAYIKDTPRWFNWLITIVVAWISIVLFMRYYIENHIWFHIVAKIVQMISAIFFVYVCIMFFHKLGIRIDFKISLIVIVLAVDVIYFYEAFALWMNKRFGFKTVFIHNNH